VRLGAVNCDVLSKQIDKIVEGLVGHAASGVELIPLEELANVLIQFRRSSCQCSSRTDRWFLHN
jgi:hypothetical protein